MEHDWGREYFQPDLCWQHRCRNCGTVTDEVVSGVPNVHGDEGAAVPEECDEAIARSVMES